MTDRRWDSGSVADLHPCVPKVLSLTCMRAVQITRFGGPEVLDVVDLPDPTPGDGEQLYEVTAAGINYADTHQSLSRD
jgi:hypothetical protein